MLDKLFSTCIVNGTAGLTGRTPRRQTMEKILLTRVCSTDILDGTDKPYVYYAISLWKNNEWDVYEHIGSYKEVRKKYPNISLKVRHVQHDIPAPPKQSDMKSQKDKEATKRVEPKKNDMSLKALLPKKDLEKTIKNPETGNKIKIKTALGYDKTKPAYKVAQSVLKQK
jgi:hypothetical protein